MWRNTSLTSWMSFINGTAHESTKVIPSTVKYWVDTNVNTCFYCKHEVTAAFVERRVALYAPKLEPESGVYVYFSSVKMPWWSLSVLTCSVRVALALCLLSSTLASYLLRFRHSCISFTVKCNSRCKCTICVTACNFEFYYTHCAGIDVLVWSVFRYQEVIQSAREHFILRLL